uniref:Glutamate receptor n=1 Tax=Panagrellus redivivus TaxID=6233 RepID=A0A7E4VGJ5_PANRE
MDGRDLQYVVLPGEENKIIAGKGMPIRRDPTSKGNLIINFRIGFPKSLTAEQIVGISALLAPPVSTAPADAEAKLALPIGETHFREAQQRAVEEEKAVYGEPAVQGAVLREKEDAHLVAAFTYAVEWVNAHRPFGRFEYVVEFIAPGDHFGALAKACKLIEDEKVVALFGSSDIYLNLQLQKITDEIDIPFFTVIDDFGLGRDRDRAGRTSPIHGRSEIEVFPRVQLFEALSDLIRHWHWTRVIVVYKDATRLARLVTFLEKESYHGVRFHFVRVQNEDFLGATRQMEALADCADLQQRECSEYSRVLVDMNPRDSYYFFLAALQMGFIELKHWFLLTSMDVKSMDMELFRHNHARFVFVSPICPDFLEAEKAHFDLEKFYGIIRKDWRLKNGKNKNFKPSEAALMFDSVYLAAQSVSNMSNTYALQNDVHYARCRSTTSAHVPYYYGRKITEHIKNTTLQGLTGDLSRIKTDRMSHGNFSFRINLLGYSGTFDDIGFWEPKTDVNVNMSRDSKAQLQQNVKVADELKPHFRVTTIMERPYVMLKKNHFELNENNQFEGFCIDLLEELSSDLGFTYSIHVVRDNKYGNDVYGNGTWDGMIGEILNGEADMVVAPFTANFRRAEVVDFTKPFLSLGISILFKIPADRQPDLFSFMNPLTVKIWACIFLAITGLTLGMFCVARVTPYEWNLNFSCCTAHQPYPDADYSDPDQVPVLLSNNYSFFNTLWYCMSTMLKGGCDFGPRAVSTRLLGGTWWVFTLVIVSAYTANLAAVLTVSKPYIPIRNLDDLANQTLISYGTIKGGSTMQFFQESRIASHVKMWEYMKDRPVFVGSNRQGVEKVINENYAYLMESTSLEYEVQQNCNLTQIGGVLGSKGYGIALEKKSEWTDRISRQILLYQKRGIIEMKKQKWWRSHGASCSGVGSAVNQQRVSLNLYNVSGLFVILLFGIACSFVIVTIEFCHKAKKVAQAENKPFKAQLLKELRYALKLKDKSGNRICERN